MTGLATTTARLVVLLPALAALAGLLLARRSRAGAGVVAIGAALAGVVLAVLQLVAVHSGGATSSIGTIGALPLGELAVPLHLLADPLSAVVALAVTVVGVAVQGFARWYLAEDDRYPVFAASVSLFLAGMLLTVQSADLVLTLVGWEVMGWCSYLLIGHDSRRASARRAAFKAFLVTRTADLALVLGLVILAAGPRTTAIPRVIAHWQGDHGALLTAALVCLLSGIAGKSAQFPFQDWLPDAMEGPTPASALIHAATMVAAGTYVVARLFPLFLASDTARLVLAVVTAVTMVGSAVLAFGQSDLKRLLAWSTVSQVAIMLSGLAVAPASPWPGVTHLLAHAMFKALLFLAIGWLSVLTGGTTAVAMTGGLRAHPMLRALVGVGLLSLAGVPPLVGFVSKELVIGAAEEGTRHGPVLGAWLVLVALLVTVLLTAAYCTRAWLVLTHHRADLAQPAVPEAGTAGHGHAPIDTPARLSVQALGVLTVLGGLLVLTPLVGDVGSIGWFTAVLSLLLVAGAFLGVRRGATATTSGDAAERLGPGRTARLDSGLGVDTLYVRAVARPVTWLAHVVVRADRDVIDAYVRGSAVATRWAGLGAERAHTRKPSAYLVWVLLGMLAVAVAGVSLW
ncbi:NADH-quinone oxidoreductase subunit 5 family protein [Oryzihumus sp.]